LKFNLIKTNWLNNLNDDNILSEKDIKKIINYLKEIDWSFKYIETSFKNYIKNTITNEKIKWLFILFIKNILEDNSFNDWINKIFKRIDDFDRLEELDLNLFDFIEKKEKI